MKFPKDSKETDEKEHDYMKLGKLDIVTWAKNGASVLPIVLKRVDDVIPKEAIGNKILVDDSSTDGTPVIAKDFGWIVYPNSRGGVGSGANLAFHHVMTEHFISIEQDVLLARDWFEKMLKHIEEKNVAVAQGWRISNHPVIGEIDKYVMERFKQSFCSMDNNIYRTKIIRALGGFPEHLKYAGVDAYIKQRVENAGFKWVFDSSVISIHLRKGGLREHIRRYYLYGMDVPVLAREKLFTKTSEPNKYSTARNAYIAFFSPIRGLEIAVNRRCPKVVYYYPLMRFSHFAGFLKSTFGPPASTKRFK